MRLKKGQGIHYRAIPDNGSVRVSVTERNRPRFVFPNTVVWSEDLQRELAKHAFEFWYPPARPLDVRNVQWIANQCADADEYQNALIGLDDAFGEKVPIFNHPRRVAMTRRDLSSQVLEGIPGLIVPKCVRFVATGPGALERTFDREAFSYPVLIRPAASQTARGLVRVDTPFDWPKAYAEIVPGEACFMTQFVDFANARGTYVRLRIAFVGERAFLRGYTEQSSWLIRRAFGDAPDNRDLESFMDHVAAFGSDHPLWTVCDTIRRRVGLEYFGVDLGMIGQDEFVLFEANAAMSILDVHHGQADFVIIKPQIERIEYALKRLLFAPKNWLGPEAIPNRTTRAILTA